MPGSGPDRSRRAVIAGLAAAAACANDAAAAGRRFYISPRGSGDGSSWQSAASLSDMPRLASQLRGGGDIVLAADQGEYALGEGLDIEAGGSARNPIRIRGASRSGMPMPALLRGNRRDRAIGDEGLRLLRGADHLHFSNLRFRDVGNGCFHIGGPISGLVVESCGFENIYRFIENTATGRNDDASITGFIIRRCSGRDVERGFLRIRYASRDGLIEDCRAQGRPNRGGAIPAGCALDDRASAITYRRCVMQGFQQWSGFDYWNGDGFSDEEANSNIRYEACEARESTDGGFDCKSANVTFLNCVASANKRNFRIWSKRATLTNCISRNPIMRGNPFQSGDICHIWVGGEDARVAIAGLTIEDRDAAPIFELDEESAVVELTGAVLHTPRQNWGRVETTRRGRQILIQRD